MKILVTGGSGFIGSYLVDLLIKNGDRVVVLDDLSTGRKENLDYQARFFHGSVCSVVLVDRLVEESDRVYHLASMVGYFNVLSHRQDTVEDNIRGAYTIFDSCKRFHKRCLFTSSSEVYSDLVFSPMRETDPIAYRSPINVKHGYGLSKVVGEYAANCYRGEGADIRIARLFNTSGPRQLPNYGMVLPRFVTAALRGDPLTVHGSGYQRRSFCHVSDIVKGLRGLMEDCFVPDMDCVFNLGSEYHVTINELADLVGDAVGKKTGVIYKDYDSAYCPNFRDIDIRYPSIEKAKRLLGWSPELSLSQIIRDVVSYWKERI